MPDALVNWLIGMIIVIVLGGQIYEWWTQPRYRGRPKK